MKNLLLTSLLSLLIATPIYADILPQDNTTVPPDTTRTTQLSPALITVSQKEHTPLRSAPISATTISAQTLSEQSLHNIKSAATLVPSLYMPAYGSHLTAATYIRGVGSRSGSPAVGLYVDGIPYLDKTAYDFGFLGIQSIDILRGPQATLYGRGAMGGLIHIHKADPLTTHGTELSLHGISRTAGYRLAAQTYLHPAKNFAISLGAFHESQRGFFQNTTLQHKADRGANTGLQAQIAYKPTQAWRLGLDINYQYTDENCNPYQIDQDPITNLPQGQITQNYQSNYRRNLLTTGLTIAHTGKHLDLTSITSHQYLDDNLQLDNDFIQQDLFTLHQHQSTNTLTEEIILKSKSHRKWQHTTGLFAAYQDSRTTCPVLFNQDGISFLNDQMQSIFQNVPHSMSLTFDDVTLPFNANFRTPSWNAALYHQSTLKDLLVQGLSLTLGLRLDYDRQKLNLNSTTSQPVNYTYTMPQYRVVANLQATPQVSGTVAEDTWQLLPKAALQYNLPENQGNIYISAAKGYRSGGYNIQNYSDLAQQQLRRNMMLGVQDYIAQLFQRLPIPEAMKEQHTQMINSLIEPQIPAQPQPSALYYKPETSWSYELGTHLNFLQNKLQIDASIYLIQTHNLQLSRFTESGFGRILVNAGRSQNIGGEIEARASLLKDQLCITAAYGYTHAKFTRYDLGQSNGQTIDYTDNRVPFMPEHTLAATVAYRQPIQSFITAITLAANLQATGRIYWDEANTMHEPFNLQTGARISIETEAGISLTLWGKNLTDSDTRIFQFTNMGRKLSQSGLPRHFGIDLSVKL
ncbi:MAG: TonB-dependent receptor [Bacteroidaceae bacterium]|nr:TonB-dependent receptor [Bacteroidaceae bacterium]